MNIQLGPDMQTLDPNAQQVIIDAAIRYERAKQSAPPRAVAPADAGRRGDEQFPAPVDAIKLIDTTVGQRATIYQIEVSVAGTLDHINVIVADDGSVEIQPGE